MDGQMTVFQMLYPTYAIGDKPIRLIETFAGYGSQAMALKRLGVNFEHYRMMEIDKYAVESYNAIHGTDFGQMDICKAHAEDFGIVEKDKYEYIFTYSFPCTDISLAGQRKGFEKGSGTRSALVWEVERILDELDKVDGLPQILLMENVSAIQNDENRPFFMKWLDVLVRHGYSNHVQTLNAVDYGIPQNRERTFVLSILGEYNFDFPNPMELNLNINSMLDEDMTEEQALQLIVKSEKAKDLLVELDGKNELQ